MKLNKVLLPSGARQFGMRLAYQPPRPTCSRVFVHSSRPWHQQQPVYTALPYSAGQIRLHHSSGWMTQSNTTPRRTAHTDNHRDGNPSVDANIESIRKGDFQNLSNPEKLTHFRKQSKENPEVSGAENEPMIGSVSMPHPIWTPNEVEQVEITHKKPKGFVDNFAYLGVKLTRFVFDTLTGYNFRVRDNGIWINRLCFLETVAGVPGMVAAMVRHLHSLRRMRRDHGWIHTLLEEAENERMHLMVFLQLKRPSRLFRLAVMTTQGIFVSGFSVAYLCSPRLCHRFVGYLEEEAVVTYTKLLKDIESGTMQHWQTQPASQAAVNYWHLAPEATMKDVILAIRADEAHHRVVNHTLSSLNPDDYNPYKPGE